MGEVLFLYIGLKSKNSSKRSQYESPLFEFLLFTWAFDRCMSRIIVDEMIFTLIIIFMLYHIRDFQLSKAISWPSKSNPNSGHSVAVWLSLWCWFTTKILITLSQIVIALWLLDRVFDIDSYWLLAYYNSFFKIFFY